MYLKKYLIVLTTLLFFISCTSTEKQSQESYKETIKKIKPEDIPLGSKTYDVYAETDGKIRFVNNKVVSKIAHLAGCPKTKEAGVYIYYNTGAKVKKGDKLMTIYAESEAKLTQAIKYLEENNPFYIGNIIYEELDGRAEILNHKNI